MLEGEKIRLRALKVQDIEKTHEWRNNLDLIKVTQGVRFPKTMEMEKEWFDLALNDKSNRNVILGIVVKGDENLIGIIQLNNIEYISGTTELGIVIGDSNLNEKGFGKESMNLLIRYAFDILNLRKISIKVTSVNDRAISMYTKLGFVEEGRLINHFYFDNKYQDIILMSLFREKFHKQKEE